MDAIARHEADGAPDLLKPAERGELIEQEENWPRRLDGRAGEIAQGGVDHQAQPAVIGFEPVGRQDQKHRCDAVETRSAKAKSDRASASAMRGLSGTRVWRCAVETTPENSAARWTHEPSRGAGDEAARRLRPAHLGEEFLGGGERQAAR